MALPWTIASMPMSVLHWGTQNWTQYPRCGLSSVEGKGRFTSRDLLAASRILFAFLQQRHVAGVQPGAHQDRWLLSAKLLSSWVDPSTGRCVELSSPGASLYTSFAWTAWGSAHYSLSARFSSLWGSLQTAVWPSGVSAALPSSVPSANLQSLHPALSPRSLLKVLDRTGCCGTRPVLFEFLCSTWYSSSSPHGSFSSALTGLIIAQVFLEVP